MQLRRHTLALALSTGALLALATACSSDPDGYVDVSPDASPPSGNPPIPGLGGRGGNNPGPGPLGGNGGGFVPGPVAGNGGGPGPGPVGGSGGRGPVGGSGGNPNPGPVDAGAPPQSFSRRYEAETGRVGGQARVLTMPAGFSGTGFVDVQTNQTGTVDLMIDSPGGQLEIELQYYTYRGAANRTLTLGIGNNNLATVQLPDSGANWATTRVTVTLPAGMQTLRINFGPQGGVDVDFIVIRTPGSPPPPPRNDAGVVQPPPPTDAGVVQPPPRMDAAPPPPRMDAAPPPPRMDAAPPPPMGCDAPKIVFAAACNSCHPALSLPNLTASANLFTTLQGSRARACANSYIDTANPENSGIIKSIRGTCGQKMPTTGWGASGLTDATAIDCITKWIQAGGK